MASDRGLFDRLRNPDPPGARSVQQRTDRIYESILGHLRNMMNTRHDDAAAVPDYGVPSLPDVDLASRTEDVRRAIEATIRSYEPRLTAVRVRHVPGDEADPLQLRFQVSARLVTDEERVGVRFDTVVDAGGSWSVSN